MRCGFNDARALQFDHIKPVRRGLNGAKHSKVASTHSYLAILRGDKGYQLLCANCHAIKTRDEDDRDGSLRINWSHSSVLRAKLQGPPLPPEPSAQLELEEWLKQ